MYSCPCLREHTLVCWLSLLIWLHTLYSSAPLQLMWVPLGKVGAFHIRVAGWFTFHSDTGVIYPFHSPHYVFVWPCLLWPSSVSSSIPLLVHYLPASMGYRHHPSALCMCSFQGLQPNHFTCGLHPSSVDALVDIHSPNCNFLVFHPREALLLGHWVTTLPSFSCGILSSSPPMEVVLHGVGLLHLSCVWLLPIHKGMPTSDATRRSQFQWRSHGHPFWFITL